MAIPGRYGDTSQSPYVESVISIESQFPNVPPSDISFLVDTGASVTTIAPNDGHRIGVDYGALENPQGITGIGGEARAYEEPAILCFGGSSKIYVYQLPILFLEPLEEYMQYPSLLGRDILSKWKMVYSPQENHLSFEVKVSDSFFPYPSGA